MKTLNDLEHTINDINHTLDENNKTLLRASEILRSHGYPSNKPLDQRVEDMAKDLEYCRKHLNRL